MTTADLHRPEPTFRLVDGRPTHNLVADPEAMTAGATHIPDITGLSPAEAARRYREHDLAVFPWRLVDGGKNLGAFIGKGYHQLSATLTPQQAFELTALDEAVTGLGLSCGRSGLIVFDVDRPELCPPLLAKAIAELLPPFQTTRDVPALPGQVARGHYVFRVPAGRRMGSPTKWTGDNPASLGWGEVRCWNSGIAIGPGLHPKADIGGRYRWDRTGEIPELPDYLALTLPEFVITADPATKAEMAQMRKTMTRRTDPAAVDRARSLHDADGAGISGRHGATLNLALTLGREMVAGRINYDDFTTGVHDFFYDLVTDPSRRAEPTKLCEWALGQVLSDAASGAVPGVATVGVASSLPPDADVTAVGARALRTVELYANAAGRPVGLADDVRRKADLMQRMSKRVADSIEATRLVRAFDEHVVPVLVEWSALGSLRAGSTADTAAEHQQRDAAFRDAAAAAVRVATECLRDEVVAYTAEQGPGVPLDRAVASKWAQLTEEDVVEVIVRGYTRLFRSKKLPTSNHDGLATLSEGRAKTVRGHIADALQVHARAIAALVAEPDEDVHPLPQPQAAKRVPICLDTVELRIDGVNTFLNTWCPDPDDVARNGDLFMYRGKPALYTRRGGQLAEGRNIQHLAPYELIALTNERADVYETEADGTVAVAELTETAAKVGLAAVRRTLARTLVEVASTPIITPNDVLVPDATYDTSTGVLVACETTHQLAPERPTGEQVRAALERLEAFYGDFAFMGPGDKAAFWAYLFTVPLRRRMNGKGWLAVPALGIRAGKANAGKTLLSEAIGGLHGFVPRRLPDGEEELRKTILSAFESKPAAQVLVLNNVPNGAVLDSAALAEVITEPTVEGRKLGFTGEDVCHANNKLLIVNGNRWRPHDDLVSRFIPLGVRPVLGTEKRVFRTPDLEARLRTPQHHAEVLHLLHTVIRGWIAAGGPLGDDLGIRGNFVTWARTIDGLLTWAGIEGFGTNFTAFAEMEDTPDEDFLAALADVVGDDTFFTREQVEQHLATADSMQGGLNPTYKPLAATMPRDAKGPTGFNGKRSPLQGRKLTTMLNAQIDLPVERDGHPIVALAVAKIEGQRGYRFKRIT